MSELRLRPVESEDLPVVASFLAHPDLVGRRGLDADRPTTRSVAALTKAVESRLEPEHGETWVVDSDGVVGLVMADWWWDTLTPWAHVVIDPEHQGNGHGAEAAMLVCDHLFLSTPARLVQCGVPSWDHAGIAFASSLGCVDVGRKRRTGIRDGAYFDQVEFAMLRTTWEEAHAARG